MGKPGAKLEAPVTAVRELCEELGFERQVFENFVALSDELVYPLCAWEATYSCGVTVKSHHLVIYYAARWPSFLDGYVVNGHRLPTLRLQLDEVQAAACLPSSVLRVLVQDWLDCEEYWQKNSVTATDWNQHAPLPNSQKVNAMTDIVWSWNQTSEVWTLIPVNRIICGLTSQLPSNNEELLPDRVNDLRPTPLTTGTLYALSHWLSSQSS
ncbi:unnamed protein product [Dicrocoelium dendriticum]|nr:unnamed protein product [Dicrocoelium dendriticum]